MVGCQNGRAGYTCRDTLHSALKLQHVVVLTQTTGADSLSPELAEKLIRHPCSAPKGQMLRFYLCGQASQISLQAIG